MKTLPADLHGIIGGNWTQEGGSGRLTACWGVVHFPTGKTLAGAEYSIAYEPLDLHGALKCAAECNKARAESGELFLALPLRRTTEGWELGRVQFAEEVTP